jgi:hypothetical protein
MMNAKTPLRQNDPAVPQISRLRRMAHDRVISVAKAFPDLPTASAMRQ